MPTIPISKPFYHANEMKKITYLATICGLILLGLSSCQKENLKGGQFTATIAQMNNDDKVTYDGQGFAWQDGDIIMVSRQYANSSSRSKGLYMTTLGEGENATRATFSYLDNHATNNCDVTDNSTYAGKFNAIYPEAIAPINDGFTNYNTVRLPSTQPVAYNNGNPVIEGFPMYAECKANNRILKFKNLCGLLKLHLQKANTTVSSIVVSTEDGALNGLFNIIPTYDNDEELESATLTQYQTVTDDRKIISVQFTAQNIANGKDFFIYLPAREYQTLTFTITDNTGKICTKSLNNTHTFHIGASEWSSITLQNDDLVFEEQVIDEIEGSLPGIFSIAADKRVVFSKGNLQYRACTSEAGDLTHSTCSTAVDATLGEWRFAEHQYDVINTANGDISYQYASDGSYTGWVDLFRWGTSGHNSKYPYYNSTTASDYAPGSSPLTNTAYDWGYCNVISEGGDEPGIWRTLTIGEWQYLIEGRPNANSRWARGKVGNIYGLILLPDSWTSPSGINLTYANTINSAWSNLNTSNQLTIEQWGQMEEAGAVFLPIAGYRAYSDYTITGTISHTKPAARYWSATNVTSGQARYLQIQGTGFNTRWTDGASRIHLYSVRLVHEVE